MTEHRCSDCRYWDEGEGTQIGLGRCRRQSPLFNPSMHIEKDADLGAWPVTDSSDWCGEFRGIFKTDEVNFDTDAGCDP